jgi:hypothetical protein
MNRLRGKNQYACKARRERKITAEKEFISLVLLLFLLLLFIVVFEVHQLEKVLHENVFIESGF